MGDIGAAMAEATAILERADRGDLVRALDGLTEAARGSGTPYAKTRRDKRRKPARCDPGRALA